MKADDSKKLTFFERAVTFLAKVQQYLAPNPKGPQQAAKQPTLNKEEKKGILTLALYIKSGEINTNRDINTCISALKEKDLLTIYTSLNTQLNKIELQKPNLGQIQILEKVLTAIEKKRRDVITPENLQEEIDAVNKSSDLTIIKTKISTDKTVESTVKPISSDGISIAPSDAINALVRYIKTGNTNSTSIKSVSDASAILKSQSMPKTLKDLDEAISEIKVITNDKINLTTDRLKTVLTAISRERDNFSSADDFAREVEAAKAQLDSLDAFKKIADPSPQYRKQLITALKEKAPNVNPKAEDGVKAVAGAEVPEAAAGAGAVPVTGVTAAAVTDPTAPAAEAVAGAEVPEDEVEGPGAAVTDPTAPGDNANTILNRVQSIAVASAQDNGLVNSKQILASVASVAKQAAQTAEPRIDNTTATAMNPAVAPSSTSSNDTSNDEDLLTPFAQKIYGFVKEKGEEAQSALYTNNYKPSTDIQVLTSEVIFRVLRSNQQNTPEKDIVIGIIKYIQNSPQAPQNPRLYDIRNLDPELDKIIEAQKVTAIIETHAPAEAATVPGAGAVTTAAGGPTPAAATPSLTHDEQTAINELIYYINKGTTESRTNIKIFCDALQNQLLLTTYTALDKALTQNNVDPGENSPQRRVRLKEAISQINGSRKTKSSQTFPSELKMISTMDFSKFKEAGITQEYMKEISSSKPTAAATNVPAPSTVNAGTPSTRSSAMNIVATNNTPSDDISDEVELASSNDEDPDLKRSKPPKENRPPTQQQQTPQPIKPFAPDYDQEFNGMGPNELALKRDSLLRKIDDARQQQSYDQEDKRDSFRNKPFTNQLMVLGLIALCSLIFFGPAALPIIMGMAVIGLYVAPMIKDNANVRIDNYRLNKYERELNTLDLQIAKDRDRDIEGKKQEEVAERTKEEILKALEPYITDLKHQNAELAKENSELKDATKLINPNASHVERVTTTPKAGKQQKGLGG